MNKIDIMENRFMNNNQPLKLLSIENKSIEECIYNIRGQQVMIDSDIAFFFGVTFSSLSRQTRRNVDRFPSDFCFQLSDKETNDLRCQKGTTNFLSFDRRCFLKNSNGAKMSP